MSWVGNFLLLTETYNSRSATVPWVQVCSESVKIHMGWILGMYPLLQNTKLLDHYRVKNILCSIFFFHVLIHPPRKYFCKYLYFMTPHCLLNKLCRIYKQQTFGINLYFKVFQDISIKRNDIKELHNKEDQLVIGGDQVTLCKAHLV